MPLFTWIIANKELLKILYALVIIFICAIIVLKTDKFFRLTSHQGIRYFRNAFFFYGIAFIIRYFFPVFLPYNLFITASFEFFLIMGGFFLFYSLLWKKFENSKFKTQTTSSLFSIKIALFYFMAIIIVFLDYIWTTLSFLFFSQIVLFIFVSVISYVNYKKNGKKHKFLKFYFLAMILVLFAWILNSLLGLGFFNWNQGILINIYSFNIIFFLLFLYGIIKVTKLQK